VFAQFNGNRAVYQVKSPSMSRPTASNGTIPTWPTAIRSTSTVGHKVVSPPEHEVLAVAETGQREAFLQHLRRHELRVVSSVFRTFVE
jgi:hypothetical protein